MANLSVDGEAGLGFSLAEGEWRGRVSGRLENTSSSAPIEADGYLVWPDALGADAHLLRQFQDDGFEDFVAFEHAPATAELVYTMRLDPSVAGLRLVADSLEFLDASGTPRLRVARPTILSSDGTEHAGHLEVSGCRVDTDPAPPWGRPVTAPAGANCTLRMTWDSDGVAYPALVDPSWGTTGSMLEARSHHTAEKLPSGRVLVAGGSAGSAVRQTAELYDPVTGTWAATGSLVEARKDHTSHLLPDGRVLVVGGSGGASGIGTSETYSAATGTWTQAGDLSEPRTLHMATDLGGGEILVMGGIVPGGANVLASTEVFDPYSDTWIPMAPMNEPRFGGRAITLTTSTFVYVAGGRSSIAANGCLASTELFMYPTYTWDVLGNLPTPRCDFSLTQLPDDSLVLAGGFSNAATQSPLESVDIYRFFGGSAWRTSTTKLPTPARGAATALLPNGGMVMTGGVGTTSNALSENSFYELTDTSSWHQLPRLASARTSHTATTLNATQVLVVGGEDATGQATNRAELLMLGAEQQSEGAGRSLALSMKWDNAQMVRSPSSAPIGVSFRNDTGAPVTGTLSVVAWSPDGRRFARDLRTVTIPPCQTATGGPCPATASALTTAAITTLGLETTVENLALSDIPSQPVGHEGVLHAEFTPLGNAGFNLRTPNIFYQFSADYSTVQLTGERGSESLRTPQAYTAPTPYFTALSPFLDGLESPIQGRVWAGSSWQDMRTGLGQDYDYELGAGLVIDGPFNPDQPTFGPRESLYDLMYPPKQIEYRFLPAAGYRKVCVKFPADFNDGGRGETYNLDREPASFAKASVLASTFFTTLGNVPVRLPIWTGNLDRDGCTPSMYLEAARYSVFVTSVMDNSEGTSFKIKQKLGTPSRKEATWMVSFSNTIPTINVRPPIEVTVPPGLAANVGVLASRLLRMEQDGPPKHVYDAAVFSDPAECTAYNKQVGAYAGADGLHICPNEDGNQSTHNAYYKFVIGHEFGHYVEAASEQLPSSGYDIGVSQAPFLCQCLPFVPEGNSLHCLQSQEGFTAGAKEGFGHFYATRIWNAANATSPRFQYYKEFAETTTLVRSAGEKVVNVRQPPIQWLETRCGGSAGLSTEYDFLGFFWAINTAPESSRTSLADFSAIVKQLKASSTAPAGATWSNFVAAAGAVYGVGSAKYNWFVDRGVAFGVDH